MAAGKDPQRELGWAIRKLRFEAGLSQRELARRARLPSGRVCRLEQGAGGPLWATVKRVADALGVSLAELAALAEDFERR